MPATSNGIVWALPFVGFVLTIAAVPNLFQVAWNRHYGKIAAAWALAFVLPYCIAVGLRNALAAFTETGLHQYLPFVLMLGTLYTITGGLRLTGVPRGTPGANTAMLAIGTAMASIIGTPGASLVMLRPILRANRHRRQATHVFVFFIFLIANAGGALTPLGNPPLFLGYLKGVPFFWPSVHLALPTLTLCAGLLATFYTLDRYLRPAGEGAADAVLHEIEKLGIEGRTNLLLLAAALLSVLLRLVWMPSVAIDIFGVSWNLVDIVSDALLLGLALLSLLLTRPTTRRANDFAWAPMIEVAILFATVFITLIPVTEMLAAGERGPMAALFQHMFANGKPDDGLFYRGTGMLSAILDNAPTYLLFFGLAGDDAQRLVGTYPVTLAAISAGACYWGGLTYLGNAPNLMVKAIVESHGLRMPSFLGYMAWAAVCLLPWLLLVEAVFFH
jgi:Na+/H+ antiporter NhaD/arsenite permease-like protein